MCARGRATVMRTWREWVLIAAERCHNNCSARRAQPCPVERISLLAPSAKKWKPNSIMEEARPSAGVRNWIRPAIGWTANVDDAALTAGCPLSSYRCDARRHRMTIHPAVNEGHLPPDICPGTLDPLAVENYHRRHLRPGPNSNPIRDPDSKS